MMAVTTASTSATPTAPSEQRGAGVGCAQGDSVQYGSTGSGRFQGGGAGNPTG